MTALGRAAATALVLVVALAGAGFLWALRAGQELPAVGLGAAALLAFLALWLLVLGTLLGPGR
jgi:hypothetical protein